MGSPDQLPIEAATAVRTAMRTATGIHHRPHPWVGVRENKRVVVITVQDSHDGTIIQRNPDIQGVIAGNDTMALGVVAALKSARKSDVVVVGFDGSPDAVAQIKAGNMAATALQPAALGAERAVVQADQYIKTGKTGQPEKQSIDCVLVTKENADRIKNFAEIS
ncbi:substrate-binding domain-containing protein [Streptomyces sp. NPDC007000]|uniref:substrate-binding domain-containing protein n=1 Tax=Streptomyces sp. NPDC007000 TaxID=3155357 RepID=UPI0033F802F7